jgi:hypothetical protein
LTAGYLGIEHLVDCAEERDALSGHDDAATAMRVCRFARPKAREGAEMPAAVGSKTASRLAWQEAEAQLAVAPGRGMSPVKPFVWTAGDRCLKHRTEFSHQSNSIVPR